MTPLPDGPHNLALPFVRYLLDPYGVFPALIRRWGDPFYLPLPGTSGTVVTADPEAIHAITTAPPETFVSFRTDALERMLGRYSIFLQSGAAHREARRVMSPPFRSAQLHAHGAMMLAAIRARLASIPAGVPFDVRLLAERISLDVSVRSILGLSDPSRVDDYHRMIARGLATITPACLYFGVLRHEYGGLGPWARAQRMHRELMGALEREIDARRSRPDGVDLLGWLLRASAPDGAPLEREDIRDKLYDAVIASFETSAVALAWAVYEVCRAPDVEGRLRAELDACEGDPERAAEAPYLDAVVSETLRKHPSFVLLTRRLARPLTLKGYQLRPGLNASIAVGATHFDPRVYPRPYAFEPQRFLDRSFGPTEFLSFGGGAQRCFGAPFATHLIKLALAEVFASREVTLLTSKEVRAGARAVTVGPSSPIMLSVRQRRSTRTV